MQCAPCYFKIFTYQLRIVIQTQCAAYLQSRLVASYRPFQVRLPVPSRQLGVGIAQVVLRHGPIRRVGLARAHLQRCLVAADRPFHVRLPVPSRQLGVGFTQVVLHLAHCAG